MDANALVNRMYIFADKYDFRALKICVKAKYETAILSQWNSSGFVESLKLLYEGIMENDRLLKNIVIKIAGKHVRELFDRQEFGALCKDNGEIAGEVFKTSFTSASPPRNSVPGTPLPSTPSCPILSASHTGCTVVPTYKSSVYLWKCKLNGQEFHWNTDQAQ